MLSYGKVLECAAALISLTNSPFPIQQNEERAVEKQLSLRDPERCRKAWTRGFSSSGWRKESQGATMTAAPSSPSTIPPPPPRPQSATSTSEVSPGVATKTGDEYQSQQLAQETLNYDVKDNVHNVDGSGGGGEGEKSDNEQGDGGRGLQQTVVGEGGGRERWSEREQGKGGVELVPDYRLNAFVYLCPLVSEGCKFNAKAWLQDEDDG